MALLKSANSIILITSYLLLLTDFPSIYSVFLLKRYQLKNKKTSGVTEVREDGTRSLKRENIYEMIV